MFEKAFQDLSLKAWASPKIPGPTYEPVLHEGAVYPSPWLHSLEVGSVIQFNLHHKHWFPYTFKKSYTFVDSVKEMGRHTWLMKRRFDFEWWKSNFSVISFASIASPRPSINLWKVCLWLMRECLIVGSSTNGWISIFNPWVNNHRWVAFTSAQFRVRPNYICWY